MFGLDLAPDPCSTLSSRAALTLPLRNLTTLTPVPTDDCWQPLSGWQEVLAPALLCFWLQFGFWFQTGSQLQAGSWVVIRLRSGIAFEGLRLISGKVRMFSNLTAGETAATGQIARLHPTPQIPGEILRESVWAPAACAQILGSSYGGEQPVWAKLVCGVSVLAGAKLIQETLLKGA